MTVIAGMFYPIFEQTVSLRKHGENYERDLDFKLSDYYIYTRNQQ